VTFETTTDGRTDLITITVDDERLYREVPLAIIQRSAQISSNPWLTDEERQIRAELYDIGHELLDVLPEDRPDRESNTIKFEVRTDTVLDEIAHGIGLRATQLHMDDRDADGLDAVLKELSHEIAPDHSP